MKNKYGIFIGLLIIFSILLTACTGSGNTGVLEEKKIQELNAKVEELTTEKEELLKEKETLVVANKDLEAQLGGTNNTPGPPPPAPQSLISNGLAVMQLIKDKNMVNLAQHVHPTNGLSFTPNLHIVQGRDLVFSAQQVAGLAQDSTVYNWGYFLDPPMDEMLLNFNDYYDDYIYDMDYINPDVIGINNVVNTGDEIDNIYDVYYENPNIEYLEFFFIGPVQSTNTDWRSLKLVFEETNGQKYLVAIVHGQWIEIVGH